MIRFTIFTAGLAMTASLATADVSLAINLDLEVATTMTATYDCGADETFQVHYINAQNDSLAIVPIDGDERIFVNVVAASGARYVSAQYEWWTKGQTATLRNEMDEADTLDCVESEM